MDLQLFIDALFVGFPFSDHVGQREQVGQRHFGEETKIFCLLVGKHVVVDGAVAIQPRSIRKIRQRFRDIAPFPERFDLGVKSSANIGEQLPQSCFQCFPVHRPGRIRVLGHTILGLAVKFPNVLRQVIRNVDFDLRVERQRRTSLEFVVDRRNSNSWPAALLV